MTRGGKKGWTHKKTGKQTPSFFANAEKKEWVFSRGPFRLSDKEGGGGEKRGRGKGAKPEVSHRAKEARLFPFPSKGGGGEKRGGCFFFFLSQ